MPESALGIKLIDAVPLSLGIEYSPDGTNDASKFLMSVLIPKNTNFPYEKTRAVKTAHDNQTGMGIQVL